MGWQQIEGHQTKGKKKSERVIELDDNIHDLLQNYLRDLLGFYGFDAIKEFECPTGRIDLVGLREDLSIGIEIAKTSDPYRDAVKLTACDFDLRFVIVDDPERDKGTISIKGKQIIVVHYLWFEYELWKAMKIQPPQRGFTPFDEYIERQKRVEPLGSENDLSVFIGHLKNYGLEEYTQETLDAIARIYTAGMLPSRHISVYSPPRVEYRDYGFINTKTLSILRSYGIIGDYAEGTRELRKYYIGLNDKYKNLVKQVVKESIKENEENLKDLIQIYGDKAYIIAKGTKTIEGHLKLADKGSAVPTIVTSKDLVESARSACPLTTITGLKDPEINLITRYCYFLTYTSLYNTAVKFFSELESLKLAVRIPTYGSYGQYFGDEYSASEEVADFIFNKAKRPNLDENAVRFGVLATIAYSSDIKSPDVARKHFDEKLRIFGLLPEMVEEELNKLNTQGITSKLIQKGDAAPFVVLEPDALKNHVRKELEKVVIT